MPATLNLPMPADARALLISTYLEKRDLLLRLFTASLRDAALAEDVLQDLYVKISTINLDAPVDNPLAYLFRAANNIALNRHRSVRSRTGRDKAWHETQTHSVGADAVSDEVDAEARLIASETLKRLMGALSELPELSQTIVRMNRIEGLSQVEVARRLNLSISTVEKRLSSALKHLAYSRRPQENGP